jgi:hypothetical protein
LLQPRRRLIILIVMKKQIIAMGGIDVARSRGPACGDATAQSIKAPPLHVAATAQRCAS